MLDRIGIMIMAIGGCMADSECLPIPLAVTSIGAALVYIGMQKTSRKEKK